MKRLLGIFLNGLIVENPLFVIMIGLCSSMAVTTTVANGIGMGIALTFVLVMSELIISLFRHLIPESIRMPVFLVVIAGFTTIMDLEMQAYFPVLSKSMGVYIPLVVVNCIIMGRVEAYSSKQPVLDSIFDGLGMGIGYTWVLIALAVVRELLGNGTLLGFQIMPASFSPMIFFILPPGGFLVFALWMAASNDLRRKLLAGRKPEPTQDSCCTLPENGSAEKA
ncbi:MAG TPA: electron transport complex subunit E [Candidatus Deferrimicrobium sp.]|nr:electron transport complex subunit E [Candidatus Deferrimicrobium sp.]